jgi:hypothetical protein
MAPLDGGCLFKLPVEPHGLSPCYYQQPMSKGAKLNGEEVFTVGQSRPLSLLARGIKA